MPASTQTKRAVDFIFDGTKTTRNLTGYALFRGVTDWANLRQFNNFESGYGLLIVTGIPLFLQKLRDKNKSYAQLIDTYVHILEYEFRGLDGLDNMQSETQEITNGVKTLNIINKVTSQSSGTFTMRYFEKGGSTINKVHELYLRGIKDPTTQVKHYFGLIEDGEVEAGFENEVFSFFYIVTDNTMMNVEKAFYIVAAQPTNVDMSIYNIERGSIEFKELSVEFSGFPISNTQVNLRAKVLLDTIRKATVWDETQFNYTGVDNIQPYAKTVVSNQRNVAGGPATATYGNEGTSAANV